MGIVMLKEKSDFILYVVIQFIKKITLKKDMLNKNKYESLQ